MLDTNLMSKLVEMSGDEVEKFADDTFNKYAAVEQFCRMVSGYRRVLRRGGRHEGAETMVAKIEAGITIEDLESWLI